MQRFGTPSLHGMDAVASPTRAPNPVGQHLSLPLNAGAQQLPSHTEMTAVPQPRKNLSCQEPGMEGNYFAQCNDLAPFPCMGWISLRHHSSQSRAGQLPLCCGFATTGAESGRPAPIVASQGRGTTVAKSQTWKAQYNKPSCGVPLVALELMAVHGSEN